MLEQKDLNKIKTIFDNQGKKLFGKEGKKLEDRIVTQVGEMLESNVFPVLEEINKKVNNLPDKLYLSDKLADLQANVTARQRKEDEKVNLLINFLKKKKVLVKNEVEMLEEIEVFPKVTQA